MSLGKNIRRLRRDKGWTQAHLSDHTGIRIGHISKLEKDEGDPKLSTLYKLMQAFSCSPDSLLIDLNRVNTDALLKQTLERATALSSDDKKFLIRVVDRLCIALGLEQQFAPENRTPFNIRYYKEPVKSVLDESEDTEDKAIGEAKKG